MPEDRRIAAGPNCQLLTRVDGDALELTVEGELDMAATFRLEPVLDRLLAELEVRRLVWDLAGVSFIDSSGLGVLLSIRERAQQRGIAVTLAGVSDPVRRVLDLSGAGAVLGRPPPRGA